MRYPVIVEKSNVHLHFQFYQWKAFEWRSRFAFFSQASHQSSIRSFPTMDRYDYQGQKSLFSWSILISWFCHFLAFSQFSGLSKEFRILSVLDLNSLRFHLIGDIFHSGTWIRISRPFDPLPPPSEDAFRKIRWPGTWLNRPRLRLSRSGRFRADRGGRRSLFINLWFAETNWCRNLRDADSEYRGICWIPLWFQLCLLIGKTFCRSLAGWSSTRFLLFFGRRWIWPPEIVMRVPSPRNWLVLLRDSLIDIQHSGQYCEPSPRRPFSTEWILSSNRESMIWPGTSSWLESLEERIGFSGWNVRVNFALNPGQIVLSFGCHLYHDSRSSMNENHDFMQ